MKGTKKKFTALVLAMAIIMSLLPAVTLPASAVDHSVTLSDTATASTFFHITATDIFGSTLAASEWAMIGFTRPILSGSSPVVYGDIAYQAGTPYIGADGTNYGEINGLYVYNEQDYYFIADTPGIYTFTAYYYDEYAGIDDNYNVTLTVADGSPTVTTQAVSAITSTTATGNGNITALGSVNPTEHGVVWSTSENPTVALETKTTEGATAATGAFTSSITGLSPSTTYYVRAYATNSIGTSYGAQVSFSTPAAVTTSKIYYTEWVNFNLKWANMSDGSGQAALYTSVIGAPDGVAVDPVNEYIYFSDPHESVHTIYRARLDGSSQTAFILNAYATDIALDTVHGKIYYSETSTGLLKRANLSDGSNVETLYTAAGSGVEGVAVDPVGGYIYFGLTTGNICRAALNGTGVTTLIPGVTATDIAIDTVHGKIYYTEWSNYTLQRANLSNGTSVETLSTTATGVYEAVEVDPINGYIYFSDSHDTVHTIYRAALDGSGRTALINNSYANALAILSVGTAPTVTTQAVSSVTSTAATGNGNITALGTANPTQYGVVWSTSQNPTIALETKTTEGAAAATGAFTSNITGLSPSTTYYVRAYATNSVGTSYGTQVSFTTPAAVATSKIYFTENINRDLKWGNLSDGSGLTALYTNASGAVTGIAVDAVNEYIYFADSHSDVHTIFRARLDGSSQTAFILNAYANDIAVDTVHGKIYYSDCNYGMALYCANLSDGSGAEALYTPVTGGVEGVAVDPAGGYVYFSLTSGSICRTALDGTGFTTLVSGFYANDIALDTVHEKMYYTAWVNSGDSYYILGRANLDGTNAEELSTSSTGVYEAVDVNPTYGYVYFSNSFVGVHSIYRANLDGSGMTTLIDNAYANALAVLVRGNAPTVTTQAVSAITSTTATGNGNITALGTANPTQYGVVWSTSENPTVALGTKTTEGATAATGAFTSSVTGLTMGTTYYVRAYATNSDGTSYGAQVSFTTPVAVGVTLGRATLTDGKYYYTNAAVTGDGIRTIIISFSQNITTGDGIYLPISPAGFTVSDTSNAYTKRINLDAGISTNAIQSYLRGVGFTIAGNTQTVSVTVLKDIVTADTFYNTATGHYYQFIRYAAGTTGTWTNAYSSAKNMTYMGRTGYLATVTSLAEDSFLYTLSGGATGWLGGTTLTPVSQNGNYYDSFNTSSNVTYWYWACGPEIGNHFYTSQINDGTSRSDSISAGYYFNWGPVEPNSANTEQCLTTLVISYETGYGNIVNGYQGTAFSWNNIEFNRNYSDGLYSAQGYFVEYGNQLTGDSGGGSSEYATASGELSTPCTVSLGTANWTGATTYSCSIDLSDNARMVTISVNSGYFTVPSLGTALTFLGGTSGSSFIDAFSSDTHYDSAVFSFTDVAAAEALLGNIAYNISTTPQTVTATVSRVSPEPGDIYFGGHFYRYVVGAINWMDAALASGGTEDTYFGGRGYLATATSQAENSILLKLVDTGLGGSDHWNDAWLGGLWQRNIGTIASPIIIKDINGNELTYDLLYSATDAQRRAMLVDYTVYFPGDFISGDSSTYIYNNPGTILFYWLDGPEAGQEIANNTSDFSPWHSGEPNSGDFVYIGWQGAYWDDMGAYASEPATTFTTLSGYIVEFSGFDGGSSAGIVATATTTTSPLATVSSVTPPSNGIYKTGDTLEYTVNFSENVTVTGSPYLTLTIGSSTVHAVYASGSGTSSLKFRYTVASGDLDADGVALSSNITLNGGTIRDAASNNAILTFSGSTAAGVLVDGVAPSVSSVTPPTNGTYKTDDTLEYTVTFSEAVTVSGSPYLTLTIGSTTVQAVYAYGSGSSALTFRYTVASGDLDADGVALSSNITLNSGSIEDAAGNDATLTFTGSTAAGVLVDGVAPTVSSATPLSNGTYKLGEVFLYKIDFNETVTVTGMPYLALTIGSSNVYAYYVSGSGSSTLNFVYIVSPTDLDTDGVTLPGNIVLNGGTIRDAAGNNATLTFTGSTSAGVLVDGVVPVLTSIACPSNGTYGIGNAINYTCTLNEAVYITGSPYYTVTIGSSTVHAYYSSGSGTQWIVFGHTVVLGEFSNTGVIIQSDNVVLNGGTIRDAAGNNAIMNYSPLTILQLEVFVDGTAPTIVSSSLAPDNSYIDITFSEGVYGPSGLAPTPSQLALNYNAYGSSLSVSIRSLTKTDGGALSGGETTIRVYLNLSSNPTGLETLEINPANASSIYDAWGSAVSASQTTGTINLYDRTSPIPGNNGTITVSDVAQTSLKLSWARATDARTSQTTLQYKVVYSLSDNILTIASAEFSGTVASNWTSDLTELTISSLQPGTTYYFCVLVRDAAGNKAIYKTAVKMTERVSTGDYTEVLLPIPDGVDPSRITTAVVRRSDGTTYHVPTQIVIVQGVYYAKIHCLTTDGGFELVWNPVEFTDTENHWAAASINNMGSRMVVNGIGGGLYEPERNITRAEFAVIVVRALGLAPGAGSVSFTDVSEADWYYDYVRTAVTYGIIKGYGDNTFGPDDLITREQAMLMLSRAMKLTGLMPILSESEIDTLLAPFADKADIAVYAREGVAACVKTGVVLGTSEGLINPKGYATRAEVAVMAERLLRYSGLID